MCSRHRNSPAEPVRSSEIVKDQLWHRELGRDGSLREISWPPERQTPVAEEFDTSAIQLCRKHTPHSDTEGWKRIHTLKGSSCSGQAMSSIFSKGVKPRADQDFEGWHYAAKSSCLCQGKG